MVLHCSVLHTNDQTDSQAMKKKEWKELIYLINSQLLYCDYITFKRIIVERVPFSSNTLHVCTTFDKERSRRGDGDEIWMEFFFISCNFFTT